MRTLRRWFDQARTSGWMLLATLAVGIGLYALAYNLPLLLDVPTRLLILAVLGPMGPAVAVVLLGSRSAVTFGYSAPPRSSLYALVAVFLAVAILIFGNLAGNNDPRFGGGWGPQLQFVQILIGFFALSAFLALKNPRKIYEERRQEKKPEPARPKLALM
ncbi:MAG: hypothetical protein V4465_03145 [Patescibacteria group bacterium]